MSYMDNIRWKKLDGYREIASVSSITVIRPIGDNDKLDLSCHVCHTMLRGIEDSEELLRLGACRQCTDRWAYINYDKWIAGWRPSIEQVGEELKERKNTPVFQITLKQNT